MSTPELAEPSRLGAGGVNPLVRHPVFQRSVVGGALVAAAAMLIGFYAVVAAAVVHGPRQLAIASAAALAQPPVRQLAVASAGAPAAALRAVARPRATAAPRVAAAHLRHAARSADPHRISLASADD